MARDVVRGERIMSIAVKHKIGTAGASSPTTFSTVLPITLRGSPANLALQLEEGPIVRAVVGFRNGSCVGSDRYHDRPTKKGAGQDRGLQFCFTFDGSLVLKAIIAGNAGHEREACPIL